MGNFGAVAESQGCRFISVRSYMDVRNTTGGCKTYKGRIYVYMSSTIIGNQ